MGTFKVLKHVTSKIATLLLRASCCFLPHKTGCIIITMLKRQFLKSHKVHLVSSPGEWLTYTSVITDLRADGDPTSLKYVDQTDQINIFRLISATFSQKVHESNMFKQLFSFLIYFIL